MRQQRAPGGPRPLDFFCKGWFRIKPLQGVSKPQIAFAGKAQSVEKAEHIQ
jgi:hypothetical protein